jgi:RNA polymerase sigma factor (sigma-70 family)
MANAQLTGVLRHIRRLTAHPPAEDLSDGQLLDRFVAGQEEAAFAALVRRHSGLVLGVCRRLLGHEQDAEDAFQATFLVLAKKAGSIRNKEAVGSWLYGVAFHIAGEARQQALRRRRRERQVRDMDPPDSLAGPAGPAPDAVLDEELQRLPEKFRLPLVLCYLQGKSNREAADILGWPPGSMSRRLARARELLREHLTRRGVALPAVPLATLLGRDGAQAAAPAALLTSTVRAGLAFAAGKAVHGTVSAAALTLAQGALKAMAVSKLKIGIVLLCLFGLFCLGAPAGPAPPGPPLAAGPQAKQSSGEKGAKAARTQPQKPLTITGRVLDEAGKPVAGAEVAVFAIRRSDQFSPNPRQEMQAQGKADQKGTFRLSVKAAAEPIGILQVLAGAKGRGLAWQRLTAGKKGFEEAVLRLSPERILTGRLVDLQGVPAAKVKGRILLVERTPDRQVGGPRIGPILPGGGGFGGGGGGAMMAPMQLPGLDRFPFQMNPPPKGFPWWPKPLATDAQGRFRIAGFGRDQTVQVLIDDDRFALQELTLKTGTADKPKPVAQSLAPAQRVEGRVVYEDTGKPAVGARVAIRSAGKSRGGQSGGAADARGRFRVNCYQGTYLTLRVDPAGREPYLAILKQVPWPKGAVSQKVDIALPRGVRVQGKVVDRTSGKPVGQVRVTYLPRPENNPSLPKSLVDFSYAAAAGPDGAFALVVPAGPGHLLANAPGRDFVGQVAGSEELLRGKPGGFRNYFHGVLALDLKPKQGQQEVKLSLRRGITLRGKLVGPDGKPVPRAVLFGPGELLAPLGEVHGIIHHFLGGQGPRALLVRDGSFELHGCDPDRTYRVLIRDYPDLPKAARSGNNSRENMMWAVLLSEERRRGTTLPGVTLGLVLGQAKNPLGAAVEISAKKANGKPLTVKLSPCGSARIRFVDEGGKPLKPNTAVEMEVTPRGSGKNGLAAETIAVRIYEQYVRLMQGKALPTPDAEGRLSLPALIPGVTYRVKVFRQRGQDLAEKKFTVQSGKTTKLPDLVVKGAGKK